MRAGFWLRVVHIWSNLITLVLVLETDGRVKMDMEEVMSTCSCSTLQLEAHYRLCDALVERHAQVCH